MKKSLLLIGLVFVVLLAVNVSAVNENSCGVYETSFWRFSGMNTSQINDTCGKYNGTNTGSISTTDYPTFNTSGDGSPYSRFFNSSDTSLNGTINITGNYDSSEDTISIWFKPLAYDTYQLINFVSDDLQGTSYSDDRILISPNVDGFIRVYQEINNSGTCTIDSDTNYTINYWNHFVLVCNSSGFTSFLNGVKVANCSAGLCLNSFDTDFADIGGYMQGQPTGQNPNSDYIGYVDEVRIFNSSLNSTQIGCLYNYNNLSCSVSETNTTPSVNIHNNSFSQNNTNVQINFNYTDDDNNINCSLYNGTDMLATNGSVPSNTNTILSFTGTTLANYTTLYINCSDGNTVGNSSTIWVYISDLTPPTTNASNQTVEILIALAYQSTVSDNVELAECWFNDTSLYDVNDTGYIYNTTQTNTTGITYLNFSCNDSSNNIMSMIISITIENNSATPNSNYSIFLIPSIQSYTDPYYTFRRNDVFRIRVRCLDNLHNYCNSSVYCNISIDYPDNEILVDNQAMDYATSYYGYNLSALSTNGIYPTMITCYGSGDAYTTFSFQITPSGTIPSSATAIFYFIILLSLVIFLILSIYGIVKVDSIWGRYGFVSLTYVLLTAIMFIGWRMAMDFITSNTFIAGFLEVLYLTLFIGFFPYVLVSFLYIIYSLGKIKQIQRLIDKGVPYDEAVRRVKRK